MTIKFAETALFSTLTPEARERLTPYSEMLWLERLELSARENRSRIYLLAADAVPPAERKFCAEILTVSCQPVAVEVIWSEQKKTTEAAASLTAAQAEFAKEEEKYAEQVRRRQEKNATRKKSAGTVLIGGPIRSPAVPLREIKEEERTTVVEGYVFNLNEKEFKTGRRLVTCDVSDHTNSLDVKFYLEAKNAKQPLDEGLWYRLRGEVITDKYTNELTMMAKDIMSIPPPALRLDLAAEKRVELHLHTRMSDMDGMSAPKALVRRAAEWGHEAVAITDHGVVQAFPEAAAEAAATGGKIKVIFGMEGYLLNQPFAHYTNGILNEKMPNIHIILLARNAAGLKNLYRIVTASHLQYFYRRPRLPREFLAAHREGLLIGSACEAGEVYQAVLRGAPAEELRAVASFYDYLEIQPIANNNFLVREGRVADEEALRDLNRAIVALGDELGLPVVATCDVHFLEPEDEVYRRIIMAAKGFEDADNQAPLFLRSTEEMLAEFAYLGEETAYRVVVTNTRALAAQVEKMAPFPSRLHIPHIPQAAEKIQALAAQTAHSLYGEPLPAIVAERLAKELGAIVDSGYAVLYYIAHLLVKKSNEDGYLVGSRGSVGSSLAATLTGITEVNPLPPHYRCPNPGCRYSEFVTDGSAGSGVDLADKDCPLCSTALIKDGHDIPFETFLGFAGEKVPDIDLNFSGDYQARAHKFVEEFFGGENIFRAGTIATIAKKSAGGYCLKYAEEHGETFSAAERRRLIQGCVGVKRTTGQHPGGLLILPKDADIHEFTPLQYPANDTKTGTVTTHFEYDYLHDSLVKLDLLGHDDPTVIRLLEDLTGVDVKTVPLDDERTLSLFSGTEALAVSPEEIGSVTGTLGIPEFGTDLSRQILADIRPRNFSHLVRISGLSHGTNVWRGNAQDLVRAGTAGIEQIIACRDDIMTYLMSRGMAPSLAFAIMESVRKGKGVTEEWEKAIQAAGAPSWYADSCRKIKYMFPKAHAVAYVTMAMRIAWFKVYYPEAFYVSFFTVRADEFDADIIAGGREACLAAITLIEEKKWETTQRDKNLRAILELAVEMYARGIALRRVDINESHPSRFLVTGTGILPPFTALKGIGAAAAQQLADSRSAGKINCVEDFLLRGVPQSVVETLRRHGSLAGLPESNQLTLF
ncbi:MAG: PolC-type DNA polymerase III [Gracilibacteraceae bacterium]|jgi:DNA polymerase-3 subunit alpha (Gram-positive type)|nr:PolC-type DNA polymerase III [Gracilibacteraceae bacterium]